MVIRGSHGMSGCPLRTTIAPAAAGAPYACAQQRTERHCTATPRGQQRRRLRGSPWPWQLIQAGGRGATAPPVRSFIGEICARLPPRSSSAQQKGGDRLTSPLAGEAASCCSVRVARRLRFVEDTHSVLPQASGLLALRPRICLCLHPCFCSPARTRADQPPSPR
jgi:hypothetical protein